jgi:hypothetical protein
LPSQSDGYVPRGSGRSRPIPPSVAAAWQQQGPRQRSLGYVTFQVLASRRPRRARAPPLITTQRSGSAPRSSLRRGARAARVYTGAVAIRT